MKIYLQNSLSRKKEEFKPLKKNEVGLYTCGPTVYDYPHIGNLSAYVIWDVLKRFFMSQGYQVKHIMNLTDVGHLTSDADEGEDKMEAAKRREKKTAWQVAQYFIDVFKHDIAELNILPPTKFLRATDTIEEQIDFVKILDKKGYLYKTSDGMYFDTGKIKDYGRLANLAEVEQQEGARVAKNPEKRNGSDFAVWKFSPKDSQRDMEWDSPWGKGFPGWHLECSVMSHKELGDTFDIHTGGVEHMTVHHPNEMAQSEAVTGKIQANYWLHNQHLRYEGGKMSKSAGVFIKLSDLEAKEYSPMSFRYFILQNNYRKPHNFSWDALTAAQAGLKNILRSIAFLSEGKAKPDKKYLAEFYQALSEDLNTARALSVLQKLLESKVEDKVKLSTALVMDEVLGFDLKYLRKKSLSLPKKANELLKKRQVAREGKDWAMSDQLRDKLAELQVEVQDTADGQKATYNWLK